MCSTLLIVTCSFISLIQFCMPIIVAENVTAIPADSFVESVGVNVHWAYKNVYTYNYTGLKTKLTELGIRYVRDRTHSEVYIRANDLYNSLGIKSLMITGRFLAGPSKPVLDPTQIDAELNEIKTQALLPTIALEGPNEYNIEHGPDPNWVENLRNYSILLYNKAKADGMLKDLPIIGPSLTSLESYDAVGSLDHHIDYANLHMYFGDGWPGFSGWDANGTRSITWYLNDLARRQSPSGRRIQATETGYHNYLPHNGISEEADGKYVARTFMELFRRGIYRSYKYELVNQNMPGQEGVFGLLRHDLSEKPSFRAVKNLITIFSDKGPSFEPGSLNYTLNGSMNNVRQLLFQKHNGNFYLVVWLEVPSWNITTQTDLYPSPQQLVLTLQDDRRRSNVTLYAFNKNADMNIINLTIHGNQVTFNATDKISIIKLSDTTHNRSFNERKIKFVCTK